jgi:hypothetical protein
MGTRVTRGSVRVHLSQEVRSEAIRHVTGLEPPTVRSARFGAIGHVAAPGPTSAGRRGLESYDTWQHRNQPQLEGEVRSHITRGSVWMHAL